MVAKHKNIGNAQVFKAFLYTYIASPCEDTDSITFGYSCFHGITVFHIHTSQQIAIVIYKYLGVSKNPINIKDKSSDVF